MKKLIFMILTVSLLLVSGCRKEECKQGLALKENFRQLKNSLKQARIRPERLPELCGWIQDQELDYLSRSSEHLRELAEQLSHNGCEVFGLNQNGGVCELRHDARLSAELLESAIKGKFGITENLDEMCRAYRAKGLTAEVEFYLRDTIRQIYSPLSIAAANTLLNFGRCGGTGSLNSSAPK